MILADYDLGHGWEWLRPGLVINSYVPHYWLALRWGDGVVRVGLSSSRKRVSQASALALAGNVADRTYVGHGSVRFK